MLLVQEGEQSARVVALQILLNRQNPNRVVSDGTFGPKTRAAVDEFRDKVMKQSGPPGVADPPMWRFMLERARLQTIDSVDITDPTVALEIVPPLSKWTDPIVLGGMSNGVAELVSEVRSRVRGNGSLLMLRLHGHGSPGLIAVSHGSRRVSPGISPIEAQSIITLELMRTLQPVLEQLAPLFNNFGFVELHSCRVGEGANGATFVRQLANTFRAPVRAALSRQHTDDVFTLVGNTLSEFPRHIQLLEWAYSRDEALRPLDLFIRK